MRSADLPRSYRTYRLVILILAGVASTGLMGWATRAGLPQEVGHWAGDVLHSCWQVWTVLG